MRPDFRRMAMKRSRTRLPSVCTMMSDSLSLTKFDVSIAIEKTEVRSMAKIAREIAASMNVKPPCRDESGRFMALLRPHGVERALHRACLRVVPAQVGLDEQGIHGRIHVRDRDRACLQPRDHLRVGLRVGLDDVLEGR